MATAIALTDVCSHGVAYSEKAAEGKGMGCFTAEILSEIVLLTAA